jgi:hypothetical protein
MTDTHTDYMPGFLAEEPEHCHACYRLVRPGPTYYLTMGQVILCEGCLEVADAIRVTDELAVVVEDGRIQVRRGDAAVEVLPREVRHLVDPLVEGAGRLVGGEEGKETDQ